MARTMKNLKIRKFLTMQGYKNADIGEDDLCIVLNGDQPLIQVTEMPTADEGELDKVYQYVGSGGQYNYGWFYRCFYNSNNNQYYWGNISVQESATPYSTSAISSISFGSFNGLRIPAFRFRDNMFSQTYRDTFGILVKIVNTDTGDVFYGKAESFGGVRKCRTYAATGIFSEVRFSFYKTSSSSSIYHFGLIKPDGSMIDSNGGNYYYSIQAYGSWAYAESELYPQAVNYNYYDVLVFDELPDTTVNGQTGNVIITPSSIGAVPQYSVIPSALDVSVGSIVQYIGATDATYTNGYFYKNNAVITPSSATISQTSGSGLSDITVDKEVFESTAQPSSGSYVFSYNNIELITPSEATNWDVTVTILNQATFIAAIKQLLLSQTGSDAFQIVSVNCSRADMSSPTQVNINVSQDNVWWGQLNITPADWGLSVTGEFSGTGGGDHTILHGYYSSSNSWMLSGSPVNISYYGIAYTGTETIGDELTVAYTAVSYTGGWDQTDVQPAPSGLPDQTGQSGKFLTTDGTDASWSTTISGYPTINYGGGNNLFWMLKNGTKTLGQAYYFGAYNQVQYEFLPQSGSGAIAINFQLGSTKQIYCNQTDVTLGKSGNSWKNVYTQKLNNGADIAVPTTGGTMVVATPPTTPNTTWVLKATVDANGDYTVAWVQEV